MSERSRALRLLEEIKTLCEEKDFSTCVRAIAMQAAIFERLDPILWEESLEDGRKGMSLAVPEGLT